MQQGKQDWISREVARYTPIQIRYKVLIPGKL
jgi:hypothetical protein